MIDDVISRISNFKLIWADTMVMQELSILGIDWASIFDFAKVALTFKVVIVRDSVQFVVV